MKKKKTLSKAIHLHFQVLNRKKKEFTELKSFAVETQLCGKHTNDQ